MRVLTGLIVTSGLCAVMGTPAPTPQRGFVTGKSWFSASGCTADENCFYSPNYPASYVGSSGSSEHCWFVPQASGTLRVEELSLEPPSNSNFNGRPYEDTLQISGTVYTNLDDDSAAAVSS